MIPKGNARTLPMMPEVNVRPAAGETRGGGVRRKSLRGKGL